MSRMDRDTFEVLLDLTRLPPASFASTTSPLSKTFLQDRQLFGSVEPKIPIIALAILMKDSVSSISSSSNEEYVEILKAKKNVFSRYYRDWGNFRPQDDLEKWLCFFERFSPNDSGGEWEMVDQNVKDLDQIGDYDIGMRIWKAVHDSDLPQVTSTILWLHYFFTYAPKSQYGYLNVNLTTPGIAEPRLSTEKMVILAMNDIEHKPGWKEKIHDETIVGKWREECSQQGFTSSMLDWMIDALRFKANSKDESTGIEMAPPPSTFQSDCLIDDKLQADLNEGFNRLMKTDPRLYDWHPGSNEMVLDLVHPSMYCLALRRSHLTDILSGESQNNPLLFAQEFLSWFNGSESETASSIFDAKTKSLRGKSTVPAQSIWLTQGDKQVLRADSNGIANLSHQRDDPTAHRYQWTPTDIHINSNKNAKLLSYINSLNDERLETSLEDLVTNFVPMFENVLTTQNAPSLQHNVHGPDFLESFRPEGFDQTNANQYFDLASPMKFRQWKEEQIKKGKEIPPCPPNPHPRRGWVEDEEDIEERHWRSIRKFLPPEVKPFVAPDVKETERASLKDRTIQIIFKLATVELTPEKPEYNGGVWHIEGTYSEQICATGIYYLESSNITDPILQFRQKIEDQTLTLWRYNQGDHESMNRLFGDLNDGTFQSQKIFVNLGHISTPGKRAIVFPNTMQHKLSPFKLIDPTKPGYRRMIVMFLVNPFCRITSTAEISRQQCHERETALAFGVQPDQLNEIKFGSLPYDISILITKEMLGKSQKAFMEFKRIMEDDEEKAKKESPWEGFNERMERDMRISNGEGTEEDIKIQNEERYRETVDFSAPMTFEEACWHRERLMQARSKPLGSLTNEDDGLGWNLCEH